MLGFQVNYLMPKQMVAILQAFINIIFWYENCSSLNHFSLQFIPKGTLTKNNIATDNGLAPNIQQANICANGGQVSWWI